jgi:hypothetical protein
MAAITSDQATTANDTFVTVPVGAVVTLLTGFLPCGRRQ